MADIAFMKTAAEAKLGEQFLALSSSRPADALAAWRRDAFGRFAGQGLPHRRIEAWHYTDLRTLLRDAFPPAETPGPDALARARAFMDASPTEARCLVVLDGVFVPALSDTEGLPAGVRIGSTLDVLAGNPSATADLLPIETLGAGEAVLALNGAFVQGGVVLNLDDGAAADRTVELLYLVSGHAPAAVATRSLIRLGAHASLTLVERHVSLGAADIQGNHAMVFGLADGAAVDHVARIEGFSAGSLHLGTSLARLGADARFASFTLAASPGTTRRQSFLEFAGPHSSVAYHGVSLLDGRCHADTTLVVTHTAPHCESREYYKTILDDEATGVYQGKVVVAPGAQKTDGKMMSRALFLAEGASMYNKPELEIFADDVVCGHGATVGNLDEDQLFYLRARGVPRREAEALLLNAFAADAIEGVATEAIRDDLTRSVEQWLRKRHA